MFRNFRKRSQRIRRSKSHQSYSSLEGRRMLAGNVTVANTDNLFIRGDNADNQIEIIGNDDGSISVIGKNGTTVNGQANPLVIQGVDIVNNSNGVRASFANGIRANFGQGNDSVLIEGVEIQGSSIVYGGSGDDAVGAYQTNFGSRLLLQTFTGNDSVSLDTSSVGGDLFILTLDGEDTIGIDGAQLSANAFVIGGNNNDRIALSDTTVSSELLVLSQNGNDYISVENLEVGDFTGVFGGDGNDEVSVEYSDVDFIGTTLVGGQSDTDRVALNITASQSDAVSFRTFEADGIADNMEKRDAVFNDLIVSGARLGTVTELAVLTPDLSTLTQAVIDTDLAGTLNDTPNLTVFAPLNAAFDKLPDGTLEGLSNEALTNILLFHVAGEQIFAADLVTRSEVDTLLTDESFSVEVTDDGVILNGNVTIAATDIRAKNGVVHLLNEVLIPAT